MINHSPRPSSPERSLVDAPADEPVAGLVGVATELVDAVRAVVPSCTAAVTVEIGSRWQLLARSGTIDVASDWRGTLAASAAGGDGARLGDGYAVAVITSGVPAGPADPALGVRQGSLRPRHRQPPQPPGRGRVASRAGARVPAARTRLPPDRAALPPPDRGTSLARHGSARARRSPRSGPGRPRASTTWARARRRLPRSGGSRSRPSTSTRRSSTITRTRGGCFRRTSCTGSRSPSARAAVR